MEDLQHLQPSKNILNQLQYFLSAAALSLLLNLGMPNQVSAQNKQIPTKEVSKDSLEKKEVVDERKEINKLRHAFKKGHYGSDHVISLLGGRFMGEHGKTIYNNRSLTSAYDYLLLDNVLLSLLVNLGFTEDNIKFVSTKKLPYRQPYKLGYSTYEENKKKETMSDSAYSQILKRNVPIKKSVVTNYTLYTVDSTKTVDVKLAGVKYTKKEGKKRVSGFVEMPQVEHIAQGTDANNFDLAYEMMDYMYEQNKQSYDISKRQFSIKTPPALKAYIIANYNRQKTIKEKKEKGEGIGIVYRDTLIIDQAVSNQTEAVLDIINQPNTKVFSAGNYQFFKYFTDIYRRDMRFDQPGTNPIWHNAFQNDNDPEKQKNGLIDFVVLPYGTKNYSMPTLIPRQSPGYTQMDGLVSDNGSGNNQESMRVLVLNGRMIDTDRHEFSTDKGIFTLFKEGLVDRMYRIYDKKDNKTFWMYIYCGIQSQERGGSIGKLAAEKAIELKNKLETEENREIAKNTDFSYYLQNKDTYISHIDQYIQGTNGIMAKTIPNIIIPVNIQNPNNPKKFKTYKKELRFIDNTTAMIYPDSLIVGWRIKREHIYTGLTEKNIQNITIDFLGSTILLDDLPNILGENKLSPDKIYTNNEHYEKIKKQIQIEKENTTRSSNTIKEKPAINDIYNNHIYNLSNIDDNRSVLAKITNDISDVEFTIKVTQENIDIQKNKKLQKIQVALDKMKAENTTTTPQYTRLAKEYTEEQGVLTDMEQKLLDKQQERSKLLKLQQKYYMRYIETMDYLISIYDNSISSINKDIEKYQSEIQYLQTDDPVYISKYKYIQHKNILKNEIIEKKDKIFIELGTIKKEKLEKQLLIIDEKEANSQ